MTNVTSNATASEVVLFHAAGRRMRLPVGYGRFARALDAIRFAIEELPPELLLATPAESG